MIGMGGSILGAESLYEFFNYKIKKKFYFLDNLDENKILKLKIRRNNRNAIKSFLF